MNGSIWVRLRLGIAVLVIDFLKRKSMRLHQDARNESDPGKSLNLRMQADDCDEDAESIKKRLAGKD